MRYHDNRLGVRAIQRLEQIQDFIARLAIQIAGRLIAQQNRWVGHNRAGDADALLFAAGKSSRIMFGAMRQANDGERGLDVAGANEVGCFHRERRKRRIGPEEAGAYDRPG